MTPTPSPPLDACFHTVIELHCVFVLTNGLVRGPEIG